MNREYYESITFNPNDNIPIQIKSAMQGDIKSRGLFITVEADGEKVLIGNEKLFFHGKKADGTRVSRIAELENDIFTLDFPSQTFAIEGRVICHLTMLGDDGQQITDKPFSIYVNYNDMESGVVSEDERGIIGEILESIPKLEGIAKDEATRKADEILRVLAETKRDLRFEEYEDIILEGTVIHVSETEQDGFWLDVSKEVSNDIKL